VESRDLKECSGGKSSKFYFLMLTRFCLTNCFNLGVIRGKNGFMTLEFFLPIIIDSNAISCLCNIFNILDVDST
jgi:hypothetical protein